MWVDTYCASCSTNFSTKTCSLDYAIVCSSTTSSVVSLPLNSTSWLDWTSWASPLGHVSYLLKSKVLKLSSRIAKGESYVNFGYASLYALILFL